LGDGIFSQVDTPFEVIDFLLTGRKHGLNHSRTTRKRKPISFSYCPFLFEVLLSVADLRGGF